MIGVVTQSSVPRLITSLDAEDAACRCPDAWSVLTGISYSVHRDPVLSTLAIYHNASIRPDVLRAARIRGLSWGVVSASRCVIAVALVSAL